MDSVHVSFIALKVVAFAEDLCVEALVVGCLQRVESRDEGRLSWSQIGQDETGHLLAGIRRVANLFVEAATRRFPRLFQAPPMNVIEPTVVDAAEAAVLEAA